MVEARGQGPWSRPLLEPGGRTRRLMPVVEALAFIPRHPANSHGTILGNDRRITPPGSSRRQIRSKPWTYLPLESTRAQPSSQPGDRPGGWTRGIDPGLTRLRRELQMCRLPSVSLRARSGGASLRSAPPPARFAASGSDLRVLRGALRRCARYGLRVAATLSARAPTRATRRFAPLGTLRRPLRGSLAGGKQPSAACSFVSWRSFGRSFHGSMPGDQAGSGRLSHPLPAEAIRRRFASLRTSSVASAKGRAPPLRSVALGDLSIGGRSMGRRPVWARDEAGLDRGKSRGKAQGMAQGKAQGMNPGSSTLG